MPGQELDSAKFHISLECSMNVSAIIGDQIWRNRSLVPRTIARSSVQQEAIVADTIYFLLAVAAVSAAIFALSMRADRGRRGSSDGGSYDPSINDSSVASWFGPYGGGRRDW
jgi:hypothetical protein